MLKDEAMESAEIVSLFSTEVRRQPSPAESLRLLRAFMAIADPAKRLDAIEHMERLAAEAEQDAP